MTSTALREELKNRASKVEHRIYISFPRPEDHTTHIIGQVKAMFYDSVINIIMLGTIHKIQNGKGNT